MADAAFNLNAMNRRQIDDLFCQTFGVDSHDDYIEEAIAADSTTYDANDAASAIFAAWNLVYENGDFNVDAVRRWIQRSLHKPWYCAESCCGL